MTTAPPRRPVLDGPAKAQLWGLLVSAAISFYFAYKLEYGLGAYLIGAGLTWIVWEWLWGRKLAASSHATTAALLSGLAIPWGGFALAWASVNLRP